MPNDLVGAIGQTSMDMESWASDGACRASDAAKEAKKRVFNPFVTA